MICRTTDDSGMVEDVVTDRVVVGKLTVDETVEDVAEVVDKYAGLVGSIGAILEILQCCAVSSPPLKHSWLGAPQTSRNRLGPMRSFVSL